MLSHVRSWSQVRVQVVELTVYVELQAASEPHPNPGALEFVANDVTVETAAELVVVLFCALDA